MGSPTNPVVSCPSSILNAFPGPTLRAYVQVEYPEIEEGIKPRYRFMSAYEQRVEPTDKSNMCVMPRAWGQLLHVCAMGVARRVRSCFHAAPVPLHCMPSALVSLPPVVYASWQACLLLLSSCFHTPLTAVLLLPHLTHR